MKTLILVSIAGLILWRAILVATKETPFTVHFSQGNYPTLAIAEVSVSGDRKEAARKGFCLLTRYIFGGNTRKQSIAMTAPVTQKVATNEKIAMTAPVIPSSGDRNWVIRFIIPDGATLDT